MSERIIEYREALNEALHEEMERDPRVFIMGEDVGQYGGVLKVSKGILERFGELRALDTPISEEGFTSMGVGAALAGLRPIVELMYIDFTLLAAEPIINQAAKARFMFGGKASVPIVFRTQGGGGRGNAAQHSQSLENFFVHIPGLIVVQPATPADAKGLLKSAIRSDDPVVFIEHKLLYNTRGPVPEGEHLVPIGKADVKRPGRDVTIATSSRQVLFSLSAAEKLSQLGIEAEVIDLRTLKPLDVETVAASVRKTHHLLVVNEGARTGGFAAEVTARLYEEVFDYLDAPILRLTAEDVPLPYNEKLEMAALPGEEKIIAAVRSLF